MELLKKELELENSPSLSVLEDVVHLYSNAIVYYEHVRNPIFYDYQERMHKLLVRPHILQLMNEGLASAPSTPSGFSTKSELSLKKQDLGRNKDFLSRQIDKAYLLTENMKRIIDRYERRSRNVTVKAIDNMQIQEVNLDRRLAIRKVHMQSNGYARYTPQNAITNHSFGSSLSSIEETDEIKQSYREFSKKSSLYDLGEFIVKGEVPILIDELEKKLENVMEQSYGEKAGKIAEVRIKYQVQMQKLGDDALMTVVKKQMKEDMQREIDQIAVEIDENRKEMIRRIKEDYSL